MSVSMSVSVSVYVCVCVYVVLHVVAERYMLDRALPEFGFGSGSAKIRPFLQIRLISGSGQNWAGFEILSDLENFY